MIPEYITVQAEISWDCPNCCCHNTTTKVVKEEDILICRVCKTKVKVDEVLYE